jgi:hypothetical protein
MHTELYWLSTYGHCGKAWIMKRNAARGYTDLLSNDQCSRYKLLARHEQVVVQDDPLVAEQEVDKERKTLPYTCRAGQGHTSNGIQHAAQGATVAGKEGEGDGEVEGWYLYVPPLYSEKHAAHSTPDRDRALQVMTRDQDRPPWAVTRSYNVLLYRSLVVSEIMRPALVWKKSSVEERAPGRE